MDISIGPDTVALIDRYTGVDGSDGLATGELCDIADDIARAIRSARTRADHGAHSHVQLIEKCGWHSQHDRAADLA